MHVALADTRYRVERFWGELPPGESLGLVSTIAVSSDGRVLVAQRNGSPVLVFEPSGRLEQRWHDAAALDPHGIRVDRDDRVLLVDRDAHQVIVASIGGDVMFTLGDRDRPRFQAPFNHPTSAVVARDGEIYVADGYGNACVHRFSANAELIATWGRPGEAAGEFSTPHSIWVDARDRVLVADRENNRIQVFDREGAHITSWHGFYHPMDICEDAEGYIYVSDQIPRLSQLDPDGNLVGRCRPVWNVPHGIACASDGTFYVIEMNPSSLTRLVAVGDEEEPE